MQVIIEGNLTGDPELREVGTDGTHVCSFSVAEDRLSGDPAGEQVKVVNFYRFSAWRAMADNIVASLRKGDRVLVQATGAQRRWTDKDTNLPRQSVEFTVVGIGTSLRWATTPTIVKTAGRIVSADDAQVVRENEADAMAEAPF